VIDERSESGGTQRLPGGENGGSIDERSESGGGSAGGENGGSIAPRSAPLPLAITALAALAACSHRAPIASCDDDLRGVYVDGDERWMVLDSRATLEVYPLFPDGASPQAELVVAPRVIDLARTPAGANAAPALAGTLRRRYMRRAERCDATLPVHVTRCSGNALELVLADPSPPLTFSPCTWPRSNAARVVRWQRE
jgi:hypothetical protein